MFPDIKERDYLQQGNYRVDDQAPPVSMHCLDLSIPASHSDLHSFHGLMKVHDHQEAM